ncbi:MAG TPA: hypothetical protein VKX46_09980, partial [Ktedonobacteraceae bacterium]|nr:hypothetical protein [Ktedonobacteraceae bacterium]
NESPVWWEFASSADRKDYFAGDLFSGYRFDIPNKHADVILYEDEEERMTFVRYLRLSLLQYAGFPGMAHWPGKPEEDLELLTQGLIPF